MRVAAVLLLVRCGPAAARGLCGSCCRRRVQLQIQLPLPSLDVNVCQHLSHLQVLWGGTGKA